MQLFIFKKIIHRLAWSILTELHMHHCRDSNSYQIKIRESACFKIECLFCYSSFLSSSSPNLFNLIDMSNISPKSQYQGNNFRQNTGYILFQRKLIFFHVTQMKKWIDYILWKERILQFVISILNIKYIVQLMLLRKNLHINTKSFKMVFYIEGLRIVHVY